MERPGAVIGRYKLLQPIGEGASVWFTWPNSARQWCDSRAQDHQAGMDTKQVIARFEAERQALAMLDHPNIAKVFDAGQRTRGGPTL